MRGRSLPAEIRYRDETGAVQVEMTALPPPDLREVPAAGRTHGAAGEQLRKLNVYAYGVGQNKLLHAARALRAPVVVVRDLENAEAVITLKNYYRKRPQPLAEAEARGVPVYVLRSNTVIQIQQCLADIFGLDTLAEGVADRNDVTHLRLPRRLPIRLDHTCSGMDAMFATNASPASSSSTSAGT